jgi:RNA polymerase sigma-70 factor (ECF subfamily)
MVEDSAPQADRTAQPARSSKQVGRWVADYQATLYRYAYRLTGSVPDAEDLTQQAFLIAQAKRDQIRDEDKVQGWLFTILRSCFLKSRRKKVPSPSGTLEFEMDIATAGRIPREDEIDSERLQASLNELSADFRTVLVMFYFEELPYKEIARQLEVPLGTVMSRLSRAKGHLRQLLLEKEERDSRRPEQVDARNLDGDKIQTPAVD